MRKGKRVVSRGQAILPIPTCPCLQLLMDAPLRLWQKGDVCELPGRASKQLTFIRG